MIFIIFYQLVMIGEDEESKSLEKRCWFHHY